MTPPAPLGFPVDAHANEGHCRLPQAWDDDANVPCYAASTRQHAYGDHSHAFACRGPPGGGAFEEGLAGRYLFVRLPPRGSGRPRRLRLCEVRVRAAGLLRGLGLGTRSRG